MSTAPRPTNDPTEALEAAKIGYMGFGGFHDMTVPERLDQTMTELHARIEDVKARNLREVSWARRQALQEAYAAVASLNGNGVTEPADDALDAAQSAIQRLLDSDR